jgi:integrase
VNLGTSEVHPLKSLVPKTLRRPVNLVGLVTTSAHFRRAGPDARESTSRTAKGSPGSLSRCKRLRLGKLDEVNLRFARFTGRVEVHPLTACRSIPVSHGAAFEGSPTNVSQDVGNTESKPELSLAKCDAETGRSMAVRDLAIIRLLHDLGLRLGELVALDVADVDLDAGTVAVIGNDRRRYLASEVADLVAGDCPIQRRHGGKWGELHSPV